MKQIYKKRIKLVCELVNERIISGEIWMKNKCSYGDIPENTSQRVDNPDNVFTALCNATGTVPRKTIFSNRKYISCDDLWFDISENIYKDELIAFTIQHIYEEIDNPDTHWLRNNLTFMEYTQLIFDRERDLKSMLGEME